MLVGHARQLALDSAESVMINEALLIATSQRPNGWAVLSFGSAMFLATVLEIIVNCRRQASTGWKFRAWVGRVFAIPVWLLMVIAGIKILLR